MFLHEGKLDRMHARLEGTFLGHGSGIHPESGLGWGDWMSPQPMNKENWLRVGRPLAYEPSATDPPEPEHGAMAGDPEVLLRQAEELRRRILRRRNGGSDGPDVELRPDLFVLLGRLLRGNNGSRPSGTVAGRLRDRVILWRRTLPHDGKLSGAVDCLGHWFGEIWQSSKLERFRKVVEENLGINGDETPEATPFEAVCDHRETELSRNASELKFHSDKSSPRKNRSCESPDFGLHARRGKL